MLRLITFGGLSLMHESRVLRSQRPRQRLLPLLAILATEPETGVPRERLAKWLWPASKIELARHSLDELVAQARRLARHTGAGDLFAAGPVLRLDRRAIEVDIWEFDAAIAASELERAVLMCKRGRFAADVTVEGCNDVEDWMTATAERYMREQQEALGLLIRRARERADDAAVIRWLQHTRTIDPSDRETALALVDALTANHERSRALSAAEIYQRHLEAELLAPDREMSERIQQLRQFSADKPATLVTAGVALFNSFESPDAASVAQLARERLAKVVAGRWRVEGAPARSSTFTTYAVRKSDATDVHAELHVLNNTVASQARPNHFRETMLRAACLQHSAILPTLECGVDKELFHFVTAVRPRTSLKSRLVKERQLSVPEAVGIARRITQAIASAHTRGINHGDLRPKHVYFAGSQEITVGFFGVVEAIAADPDLTSQTSFALSFGDRAYQSPEQVQQRVAVSAASDVYAVGAILFHMLAGHPPFAPGGHVDIGLKLTGSAAPLRGQRERVPEALDTIVSTCLSKVPADRYPSGLELAEALAAPDVLHSALFAP